jgi:hypothetical protein
MSCFESVAWNFAGLEMVTGRNFDLMITLSHQNGLYAMGVLEYSSLFGRGTEHICYCKLLAAVEWFKGVRWNGMRQNIMEYGCCIIFTVSYE